VQISVVIGVEVSHPHSERDAMSPLIDYGIDIARACSDDGNSSTGSVKER
jgi:hypothetical protein